MSSAGLLVFSRQLDPNEGCTQATCTTSQSIYGYRSSLAATTIFLIVFFLSGCAYVYQGVKSKTWFFSGVMAVGCLCEVLGYVAKFLLYGNPFSDPGFKMSIVMLTLAPALYSAGIYYTLKHICLTFGPSFSRLPPSWYTWVFIAADCISMLFQVIGGGIAVAPPTIKVLIEGEDIMITGLTTQVFTMLVFGLFAADYAFAVRRNRAYLNPETTTLRNSWRFRLFLVALGVAYVGILIRCAYRLAELVDGWGPDNEILRNQPLFIGLDSAPCAVASVVLNIWHPGWCFPRDHQEAVIQAVTTARTTGDEEKLDIEGPGQQNLEEIS